jgi:ubiquinone/menaquinone biosynthesis C-methylase UbiE
MSLYGRYILPTLIEKTCATKPVMKQREKIVPLVEGRVLEVGAGGGLNLNYYDAKKVKTIVGLDSSAELLGAAEEKAKTVGISFEPMLADAEDIPLENNSVDSVLVTYTLCSIADVRRALTELRRVLTPTGHLVFCEHGAAPDRRVFRIQRALTPIWKHFSGNCHLDRDTVAEIENAGFKIGWYEEMYLPGTLKFAGFNRWGVAAIR